jgi:hypothetical protein
MKRCIEGRKARTARISPLQTAQHREIPPTWAGRGRLKSRIAKLWNQPRCPTTDNG